MLGLVALAGCGEQGPTRAEFARRADAACAPSLVRLRALQARIDSAGAGADPDAIYATIAGLLREGVTVSRATFDRIEALEEPAEGADQVDAWVAANRREAALTLRLADAYDGQDQKRIARLSEQVDLLEERNGATAAGLGLRRCAERVRD